MLDLIDENTDTEKLANDYKLYNEALEQSQRIPFNLKADLSFTEFFTVEDVCDFLVTLQEQGYFFPWGVIGMLQEEKREQPENKQYITEHRIMHNLFIGDATELPWVLNQYNHSPKLGWFVAHALFYEKWEIVDTLLRKGALPDSYPKDTLVWLALSNRDLTGLKLLIQHHIADDDSINIWATPEQKSFLEHEHLLTIIENQTNNPAVKNRL